MTDDREISTHRPADLVGEIDASQREMEDVVSVVDQGAPVDLVLYVAARARLDTAVAAWNQRGEPPGHHLGDRELDAPPGT